MIEDSSGCGINRSSFWKSIHVLKVSSKGPPITLESAELRSLSNFSYFEMICEFDESPGCKKDDFADEFTDEGTDGTEFVIEIYWMLIFY